MATDIVVPTLGESVTEATVAQWLKKAGDAVEVDEPIVELETDKVTLEVNASEAGVISEIVAEEGANVEVGALLGRIGEGKGDGAAAKEETGQKGEPKREEKSEEKPAKAEKADTERQEAKSRGAAAAETLSPAVRKLVEEHDLDPGKIEGSGKDGRILKEDVLKLIEGAQDEETAAHTPEEEAAPEAKAKAPPAPAERKPEPARARAERPEEPREERVRMTRLRKRIAERLKEAQNTAAMLTTFNEVDMGAVMDLRGRYRDSFEKKHGVRLGFMSFFTKAAIAALKELPAVNAEIDGDEMIYKNYYDIGIAVSTPNGLVVPVLRDADAMGFAEIEKTITDMGKRARDGKLAIEEMTGGTFTITNGGIFGSLLSTPILNPPQSGILGLHKIEERPVAMDGEIAIRPMMYVALSYDHRIIDGREAVTFLVRLKAYIEDPERLLIDV